MNQKRAIKALIFDVGGVLSLGKYTHPGIREHHLLGVHHYVASSLNIDLDAWFDAIDNVYSKSIEGKIQKNKALKIIADNLNISVKRLKNLFTIAYKKHFKKNTELLYLIHKLKNNGYKIGILSDQWYLSKDALINKKDFADFNPIIVSCDVGMRKPNPKIYKLLIKKLKLKPLEILFTDNREWNLKAARKLGIKTILFKNNDQFIRELMTLGVFNEKKQEDQ